MFIPHLDGESSRVLLEMPSGSSADAAALNPHTPPPALVPTGSALTYGAAAASIRRLAGALRALGVQPGDRVSAQVEKSPEALLLYLATLWVGGVFHPMNTAYTADETTFLLGDAQPTVVVRTPDRAAEASNPAGAVVVTLAEHGSGTLVEHAHDPAVAPLDEPVARGADDLAAILYTSGTTGRPKGAMVTHGNLSSNALALHEAWGFVPGDVLVHVLPIFHAHGLFVACNTSLLNGTAMLWQPRFDVDATIDALAHATVFMGVPTHYVRLLASPRLDRGAVERIRVFISGSAPLQPNTFTEFAARTGHRILERYGMTETQMITSNPLDGERLPGTVGFPLAGVEVRVEPGPGGNGEVEVRGPNVCAGYWRRPQEQAAAFTADGWFRTGDLGVVDADGRLTLVGREKDVIITGGFNVYPKELEVALDAMAGVAESAVVGMPHPDFGEVPVAVVVADGATGPAPDPAQLLADLRAKVASYKVPKLVVIARELPRNAMGKVQKDALRERYAAEWQHHLAST